MTGTPKPTSPYSPILLLLLSPPLLHAFKPTYFPGSNHAIDGCLVLAGFFITSTLLTQLHHHSFTFKQFYKDAFCFIYPPLFITCFLTLLSAVLIFPPSLTHQTVNHILETLLLLPFHTNDRQHPLSHIWPLILLSHYYLLFPILLYHLTKFPKWQTILPGVLMLLSDISISFFYTLQAQGWSTTNLVARFFHLGIGAFFASTASRWSTKPSLRNRVFQTLLSMFCVLVILMTFIKMPFDALPHETIALSFATVGLLLSPYSMFYEYLQGRLVTRLAGMGITVYMLHLPVLVFTRYLVEGLGMSVEPWLAAFFTFVVGGLVHVVGRCLSRRRSAFMICFVAFLLGCMLLLKGFEGDVGDAARSTNSRDHCRGDTSSRAENCEIGASEAGRWNISVISDVQKTELIATFDVLGKRKRVSFSYLLSDECSVAWMGRHGINSCSGFRRKRVKGVNGGRVIMMISGYDTSASSITRVVRELVMTGYEVTVIGGIPGIAEAETWRLRCVDLQQRPIIMAVQILDSVFPHLRRLDRCVDRWMVPDVYRLQSWDRYKASLEELIRTRGVKRSVGVIDISKALCRVREGRRVCKTLGTGTGYSAQGEMSVEGAEGLGLMMSKMRVLKFLESIYYF